MSARSDIARLRATLGESLIVLESGDGAHALLSRLGGQLLSWQPARGRERLYLSERAMLDGSQPIRGGVPIIFPRFADLPVKHPALPRLGGGPATAWPYSWELELSVCIGGDRVDTELAIRNPGAEAFECQCALHTYLRIAETHMARILGLQAHRYQDRVSATEGIEEAAELHIESELDRIYFDVEGTLTLDEPGRMLAIQATGFPDVVVWNPWRRRCGELTDMPPDGYRHMLCIEAAHIGRPLAVAPGAEWIARQTLVALR
ncbi:MAG TPA: D-hexose-6-phosphate mutarotase [Rhodocyclaceae bacterium]|nr:D-hexose-6-phosphate mutarotase [Rhodocyclaceae bacterium]